MSLPGNDLRWSPFADEIMEDPANGHEQLLLHCPVHRCQEFDPPFYTISRYRDVERALRDIGTYSSQYGQGPRFTDPQGMLCDPPQHTHLRKLVQQAFTPKAMAELRPKVSRLADQMIAEILSGTPEFDLHDDFAFPLPVLTIAGMLGVPEEDIDRFKRWSDVQVAAMGAQNPGVYAADQAAFAVYMQELLQSRRQAIKRREAVPQDLLTTVAGGRIDGELISELDALSVLIQLLVGGNETTTSLITNMVWRLLEIREHWQAVKSDRSLVVPAIEESLRFDPPVLGLYRHTTREVALHGVTIPKRAKVFINYAAANRDPEMFPCPAQFDLRRKRERHMSFGLGVHFCLGAPMARLEAEIALNALLDHMPDLRLLGQGQRIAPFFLWGRRRLPVAWH